MVFCGDGLFNNSKFRSSHWCSVNWLCIHRIYLRHRCEICLCRHTFRKFHAYIATDLIKKLQNPPTHESSKSPNAWDGKKKLWRSPSCSQLMWMLFAKCTKLPANLVPASAMESKTMAKCRKFSFSLCLCVCASKRKTKTKKTERTSMMQSKHINERVKHTKYPVLSAHLARLKNISFCDSIHFHFHRHRMYDYTYTDSVCAPIEYWIKCVHNRPNCMCLKNLKRVYEHQTLNMHWYSGKYFSIFLRMRYKNKKTQQCSSTTHTGLNWWYKQ